MNSKTRRGARAVAAASCLSLVVAACGSSSSTHATAPTSSAAAATTAAASTAAAPDASSPAASGPSSAAAATGTPITIGSLASLTNPAYSTPQNKAGMQAAIASINAAGGVNGHPLALNFCDSAYDTNKELSCTQSLLAAKVSALVDPSILADQTGREFKLIAAANTADIGSEGLSPLETASPIAFPLSSGLAGWFYGAAKAVVNAGAKKVAVITTADPASQYSASIALTAVKLFGAQDAGTVVADSKSDPTLSAAVAKATANGVDGLVLSPAPLIIPKLLQAIKQSGFTGHTASITALFAGPLIKASGDAANGVLLSSQVAFSSDSANPGIAAFQADMAKYQPSAVIDESTLFAWGAVELYAKVAATVTSYDSQTILNAFKNLSTPVDIGIVPPYSVAGKTSPVPTSPSIYNPTVVLGSIEAGAVKSNGSGFVQAFSK